MPAADSQTPREADIAEGAQGRLAADSRATRPLSRTAGAENRATAIARAQRGNITLEQLEAAGLSRDQITHRVRTGWLVRRHAGVHSIGTVGAIGLIQAALMAAAPESMATSFPSAALHHLLPHPAAVYLAVPRDGPRPRGVKLLAAACPSRLDPLPGPALTALRTPLVSWPTSRSR